MGTGVFSVIKNVTNLYCDDGYTEYNKKATELKILNECMVHESYQLLVSPQNSCVEALIPHMMVSGGGICEEIRFR